MPRVNGTVSVGSLAGRFRSVNGRRTEHCASALAWRATAAGSSCSAESERKRFQASIEELDFEQSIADRRLLSNQLIQPLMCNPSVSLFVNVDAPAGTRRLPVDGNAKSQ